MDQDSRDSVSADQDSRFTSFTEPFEQQPPDSKPLPRTLPRDSTDVRESPRVDYKDRIWTEIDELDDVKRMARETAASPAFPPHFEEDITCLRQMHSSLLQHMKQQSAKKPDTTEEHRQHIEELVETIEKYV